MRQTRVRKGGPLQFGEPDWGPLLEAVGEPVVGDFMWMFAVQLIDGPLLQAYKHIDTRRYVHLDSAAAGYAFVPPDGYRAVPVVTLLRDVFSPLPGLFGVTDEQISASWAAVARLEGSSRSSDTPGHV